MCSRCFKEAPINDIASDQEAPVVLGVRTQRRCWVVPEDFSDDSNLQPKDGKRKSKAQRKTAQQGKKEHKDQKIQIGKFLETFLTIGEDITEFDSLFDKLLFKQYPVHPKPFSLVGVPFCDGLLVPQCRELFATKEDF